MRRIVGIVSASLIVFGAALVGAAPASAAPSNSVRPHSAPAPQVRLHAIQYDSPGRDDRSNASLNAEWVSVVNTGRRAVNLRGYTIEDRANHVYRFGNVWLDGGDRVVVHTGIGRDNGNQLYWDSRNYIWNNDGDTAVLSGPRGRALDFCSYRGQSGQGPQGGRGRTAC